MKFSRSTKLQKWLASCRLIQNYDWSLIHLDTFRLFPLLTRVLPPESPKLGLILGKKTLKFTLIIKKLQFFRGLEKPGSFMDSIRFAQFGQSVTAVRQIQHGTWSTVSLADHILSCDFCLFSYWRGSNLDEHELFMFGSASHLRFNSGSQSRQGFWGKTKWLNDVSSQVESSARLALRLKYFVCSCRFTVNLEVLW